MENKSNQILMEKEKLEYLDIIKESLKLIPKNPNFIILTFLTSLPLFCFLIFFELILQQSFVQILKFLTDEEQSGMYYPWPWPPINIMNSLIQDFSLCFLLLSSALFLGIGHLLDLFYTIITVHSVSKIYTEQDILGNNNFKEMLSRAFQEVGFKGPLITSIYLLLFSSLALIGFISLLTHFCWPFNAFEALFGLAIIFLLIKYLEWNAIWNLGMVISILEENKHGDVAIGVSAYISRGSRKRGFLLMLVFFVWKVCLRLMGFYGVWVKKRSLVLVTIGQIFLVCLGNLVKWVVFTVYFYDCKKRFLEKKVDVEQGRAAEMVKL